MADPYRNGTWKSWFDAYGSKLVLYARQWVQTPADAEDVVQDGFVRFWKSDARKDVDAVALLYASVRRAGLDHLRKNRRRSAREERSQVGEDTCLPASKTGLEERERADAVETALRGLPGDQREVVVLKIWGELTFQQIATAMEIPANTAASRYRYALTALRKNLNSDVIT
ncbi:MAG: sigma-70 family RNA polymerase sigma factor [Opitutaceae bacterium]